MIKCLAYDHCQLDPEFTGYGITTDFHFCGRHTDLLFSELDLRSRGAVSKPNRGHSIVFLSKTLNSHSVSLPRCIPMKKILGVTLQGLSSHLRGSINTPTVEPPVAKTSRKRPPLLSDQFPKYQGFQVKSLYLEPLVSDHL